MIGSLPRQSVDRPGDLRGSILVVYAILIGGNVAAWTWAVILFRDQPLLLSTALLAYAVGLRHAADADHIAAIDNVTRKLMQKGKRPVTVGFFFSLGHASVVLIAAAAVAATTVEMSTRLAGWKAVGAVVGALVSAAFLFAIALINLVILRSVWRTFRQFRRGGRLVEADLDMLSNVRGPLSWVFRPLFRLITRSWQMFPLGFLFGLGFDTATEVALLGVSATQASRGMSAWAILVFPALFAAGMALVDTTDGILMVGAYNWAFVKPIRKLYYNLTITLVSVVVAVLIGGIETLGLIGERLGLTGTVWEAIDGLNANFSNVGFVIIGVFIVAWVGSLLLYRYRGYDRIGVFAAE